MPGGKGNIKPEDGRPFSTEYQPENRGRKPKLFSELIRNMKAQGIEPASPDNIKDCLTYLLALPLEEVVAIAGKSPGSNDYPSVMRIISRELLGKNALSMLKEILDRTQGRSRQAIDIEAQLNVEGIPQLERLTLHEKIALATLLEKASKSDD